MSPDAAQEFTDAERRLIALYLHRAPSRFDSAFNYAAYVLPSVLFAGYALVTASFVALLLAYVSLLIVVVMYLVQTDRMQATLYAAIRKYESRLRMLDVPGRVPSEEA